MHSQNGVSRRSFLQGLGVGSLGLGLAGAGVLNVGHAMAQGGPSTQAVVGLSRFALGDWQITVLNDGVVSFDAGVFAMNADAADVEAILVGNNTPRTISTGFNVMLIESADRKILIDTGSGDMVLPTTSGNTGKLPDTLALLNIAPGDITDVVITHIHPDHLGGMALGGEVVFSNAQHYLPQADFEWATGDTPPVLSQYFNLSSFLGPISEKITTIAAADQLAFYAADSDILPGITAVAAPGHTPGHVAILLASNGQQLLNLVDTAGQSLLSVRHPEWYFIFDAEPAVAVESRRRLLGMAADEGIQVLGYHFPFPGVGYISRFEDSFWYVPSGV